MTTHQASMSFIEPWARKPGSESPFVRGQVEDGYPSQNFENQEYTVHVVDARPNKAAFNLDKHGFAYHDDDELSADVLGAVRSKDKALVARIYYPIVENIIKKATGANHIVIFDHTYRKRNPSMDMKENPNGREQPATTASAVFPLHRIN